MSAPRLRRTWILAGALVPALLAGCGVAREVEGVGAGGSGSGGGGDASCTRCHGDPARAGDPANRPAPDAGAHLAHLEHGIGCDACHDVPTSAGHSNRVVEIVFSGVALARGARPAWDAATHRCSGVYCHRPFADGGGSVPAPSWTDRLACDACHGVPPPAPHATASACGTCHRGYTDATVSPTLHVNGQVDADGVPGGGGGASCTGCHGDPARAGDPANRPAPDAGAHLAHLEHGVRCDACHVVPTSAAHSNRVVDVVFSGLALAGGARPTWDAAMHRCSGVYCHRPSADAGGRVPAPSWTDRLACDACHGVPPPAPHATAATCGTCHHGYTDATVSPTLHVNGQVDADAGAASGHEAGWLAKHGSEVNDKGLQRCKGCHGASLDGAGGTAQGCSGCHARAGTSGWATSCTFCHGTRGGSAAPPQDTHGGSSRADVSVGAHARHLGTGLMNGMGCNVCHPDRSASNVISDAAHIDGDGVAEVALSGIARRNGSAATYTRTSATSASCASVYCHERRTVSWTSTAALGCTGCHAMPPSTRAHNGDHRSKLACDACHPGYGTNYVNRATHIDGSVVFSKTCTSCHGAEDD